MRQRRGWPVHAGGRSRGQSALRLFSQAQLRALEFAPVLARCRPPGSPRSQPRGPLGYHEVDPTQAAPFPHQRAARCQLLHRRCSIRHPRRQRLRCRVRCQSRGRSGPGQGGRAMAAASSISLVARPVQLHSHPCPRQYSPRIASRRNDRAPPHQAVGLRDEHHHCWAHAVQVQRAAEDEEVGRRSPPPDTLQWCKRCD